MTASLLRQGRQGTQARRSRTARSRQSEGRVSVMFPVGFRRLGLGFGPFRRVRKESLVRLGGFPKSSRNKSFNQILPLHSLVGQAQRSTCSTNAGWGCNQKSAASPWNRDSQDFCAPCRDIGVRPWFSTSWHSKIRWTSSRCGARQACAKSVKRSQIQCLQRKLMDSMPR